MKKTSLSILCCLLLYCSTALSASAIAPEDFADIQGHWGEQVIADVIRAGLMQGMGSDERGNQIFAPDARVSRAQAACALASAFHLDYGQVRFIKQPLASDYYADVSVDSWYSNSLAVCAFNHVFSSENRLFNPDQNISRFDMARAIEKCFVAREINVPMIMMMPVYQDTGNLSSEDQQTIAFISNTGIMKGADGFFRPYDPLSRAELAQILNACQSTVTLQVDVDENSHGKEYHVYPGQSFVLALPSNPTTGFQWDFSREYDKSVIYLLDAYYQSSTTDPAIVGQSGTSYWRFKAMNPGSTDINLRYARPWESVQPVQTYKLKVIVSSTVSPTDPALNISTRELKEKSQHMIVDMQVPSISGVKDSSIESSLNERWLKDAQDFKNSVASGLEEYVQSFIELGMEPNPFGAYSSYEICTIKPGLLSMYVDYYSYTGGAHGHTDRMAYNIDLCTGDRLKIGGLFWTGYDYASIINQSIQDKIDSSPEMYFEGAFSGIQDDQEFYIKDGQLVVYFQQYEIAAYAVGIPEFSISLSELSGGLKPDLQNSLDAAH